MFCTRTLKATFLPNPNCFVLCRYTPTLEANFRAYFNHKSVTREFVPKSVQGGCLPLFAFACFCQWFPFFISSSDPLRLNRVPEHTGTLSLILLSTELASPNPSQDLMVSLFHLPPSIRPQTDLACSASPVFPTHLPKSRTSRCPSLSRLSART